MRPFLNLLLAGALSFSSITVAASESAVKAQAQEIVELGTRYTIHSDVLSEDRQLLVRLPEGYEEGNLQYPVIYVLDGDMNFPHISVGVGKLEQAGQIPPSIVVGVPNAFGTRMRDLLNEQEAFRRFVREELFGFVNSRFRSSNIRTVFGSSLAGYFVLNALSDDRDMFTNFIAASPVLQVNDNEVVTKFEKLLSDNVAFSNSLYFSFGNPAEEGRSRAAAITKFEKLLNAKTAEGLEWRYEPMFDQVHMSTSFVTAYQGLSHAFKDYQSLVFDNVAAYEQAGGMQAIEAYYRERAEKYGLKSGLPAAVYRLLGYLYAGEQKYEEGVQFFAEGRALYPEDLDLIQGLGALYHRLNRSSEAIDLYKSGVSVAEVQNQSGYVAYFKSEITGMEDELAKQASQ